jgi:hypothetical protein
MDAPISRNRSENIGQNRSDDELRRYAPKWLGERTARYSENAPSLSPDDDFDSAPPDHRLPRAAGLDWAARRRHTLDPELAPLPPLGATSEFRIGQVVRVVAVVIGAALVAFVVASGIPNMEAEWLREFFSAGKSPPPGKAARLPAAAARLLLQDMRGNNNEWLPLAIKTEGESRGTTLIVSGLMPGTKLSSGQPIGETAWFVGAAELPALRAQAPAGFTGSMDLLVELRTPDNTILDRKMLRAEWIASKSADASNVAAAPVSNVVRWAEGSFARNQLRQLDPDEITVLLKRGEAFLTNGDVAAARLLLQRAAENGNARAAFALASSYDPAALQRLGVYGPAPDAQLARQWYGRAAEYGSKEAEARLEILARNP